MTKGVHVELSRDEVSPTAVIDAFEYYGVAAHPCGVGAVSLTAAGWSRVVDAVIAAAAVHDTVAAHGAAAALASARVAARVSTPCVDGHVLDAAEALRALVALDLVARIDSIDEASNPAEELMFFVDAGARGEYGSLGEHVAAAAEQLTTSI